MRVAVAMSGGVDSSAAAALLLDAGHDVFGITMQFTRPCDEGEALHGEDSCTLAASVAGDLGIEHVTVDLAADFDARVVEPFATAYADGSTPNPCVTCNEQVKFGLLLDRALDHGAEAMATGHYARTVRDAGGVWLERAADRSKDQSYFLYRLSPAALERVIFPLGEMTKAEVRAYASARSLPVADRRDSQEVCFCTDHVALVAERHPEALEPGPIVDAAGVVLGTHRGIARYTVGQRKRLGLAGPLGPYQVLGIDAGRNEIVVGPVECGARTSVVLQDAVWRLGGPADATAQGRYRSTSVPARVAPSGESLRVEFDAPVAALAPGQSVVLYRGDRVLGGGIVPFEST